MQSRKASRSLRRGRQMLMARVYYVRTRKRKRKISVERGYNQEIRQLTKESLKRRSVTRRMPVFSAYIPLDINNCWYLQ